MSAGRQEPLTTGEEHRNGFALGGWGGNLRTVRKNAPARRSSYFALVVTAVQLIPVLRQPSRNGISG